MPVSLIDSDKSLNWASVDLHYAAPECYKREPTSKCDVFSFGLILFELVVGKGALPKDLRQIQVAKRFVIDKFRPDIPECVLPDVRELIADCWAEDPDDRLSFYGIFKRLKSMKFKVTPDVNPLKLAKFVKEVKERFSPFESGD
jgi:hypothetical protein